jgi:hypothetical protein
VDDARIKQLAEEVLSQLAGPSDPVAQDLQSRVEALERVVRGLQGASPEASPAAPHARAHLHPALRLIDVPCGEDRCVLEPDKPCEKSGRCRTLGH